MCYNIDVNKEGRKKKYMSEKQKAFLKLLGVELEQPFEVEGFAWTDYKFILVDDYDLCLMSRPRNFEEEWGYSSTDWNALLINEIKTFKAR